MDCEQCSENLTALLDGELSPADSQRIESHLRLCRVCSEELQSLREAAEFLQSHHRDLVPSRGAWNMVRARIGERGAAPVARPSVFNRFRWAMVALAVVAIFAFGYTEYQQIEERNFERYVTQYVHERETQITRQATTKNPYESNPFLEVKETVVGNPFLSEGR
jgi:predicted anti-sigma-YlaC factor YlaD